MAKKESATSENPKVEATDETVEVESSTEGQVETDSDDVNHEELTLMLEDARAKADEHWNQLLRSNAELENTRRRARQDVENAHKFALEKFAQELLPVKDSLEMGLAAANTGADADDSSADNPGENSETVAHLMEGTKLTLKMLTSAMEKFGIEAIDPAGEPFNPEIHQAMSMQESADHAPNTVMMVMQKGYQLNERLIRPAMVVVSKAVTGAEEGDNQESISHVDEKA